MLKSYWDDLPSRSLLGWRLPLQRHGGFMTDSGFQNVRSHFDQAFKDTMSCWNNKEVDDFASYRKLRDRQLTGKDRPSSILEEGNNYKVVMDVHGFIDNDLKVTFLNDKELIVEGLIEKKSEGSFTRQSFKRRFSFPGNVVVNSAYSTLSSDNILTITVPKLAQQICHEENKSSSQSTQSLISKRSESEKDSNESSFLSDQNIESKLGSLMEFPITKRNDFFADSFFDKDRSLFKSRVSEIMNRRAMRDSFDDFSSFRSLRDKDEQNIAVTVTGDTKEHKIVLDVNGFNEGDLKVRAVSDCEFLVEGRVEKKTDNSYCNNSFRRSFCLPNSADIQGASSNLSSDGVLTIVVPKKEEKPLPIAYNIPVAIEKKLQQNTEKITRDTSIPVVIPLGYVDTISSDKVQSSKTECVIPVQMEKNIPTSTDHHVTSACQAQETLSKIESTEEHTQSTQQTKTNISTMTKDQVSPKECVIPVMMDTCATDRTHGSSSENIQSTINESKCETSSKNIQMKDSALENISKLNTTSSILTDQKTGSDTVTGRQPLQLFTPRIVPINIRGDFYNDSVFDAARQQVESAVKNAMNRSLSQECHQMQNVNKEITETSDTTGTSTVLDEIHSYKIVMDVLGFLEKNIMVKAVSMNELSVEGTMEQTKGNSITKHSFQRTFHLPDNIKIEESTSALSSDGMLTITVPKEVSTDQEILSSVSKTLTSESIEAQLSNLTKQMDQISNMADVAVQSGKIKEHIVPLDLETSSICSSSIADTEDTMSVSTQRSQEDNLSKQFSSVMDSNIQKDSFAKDVAVKTCFDLPVMKRGNFFQDSFFSDSRDTFECALRNAMGRFKSFSSFSDDLDFYKNLREEKFGGENLATGISDDHEFKKVVVDVKGYPQDRISVKVIEGNGILVEGKMEEKMETGSSTKSFKRTFFLPVEYNLKDACSALSIDGILNIKVPRSTPQASLNN